MAATGSLADRIDAEIDAAFQRVEQLKTRKVEEFQGRQQRLENLDQTLEGLREIWRPRLDALAKKFGERVQAQPQVEPGRRSAKFQFKSELAAIDLRFAVAPDADVRNLSFTYDLQILPILMKFDSHDEISFPLDAVDKAALGNWFDDRIVDFVRTYLSLHENQYYLKGHMVEDPIAKVQFPKYAAGATLEAGGKTVYFIDESTLREFQQKQAAKK
jgi:YHS domain-containing protein